jgi:hypothetical protein
LLKNKKGKTTNFFFFRKGERAAAFAAARNPLALYGSVSRSSKAAKQFFE